MTVTTMNSIRKASQTIREHVKHTPLIRSDYLSKLCRCSSYLKLENQQHTNSFKIRGALNKMSQLTSEQKEAGVVTASSGNHAQAVALAAQILGIHVIIVVPEQVSKAKLEKMREYSVEVVLGDGFDEVEPKARSIAGEQGKSYISPYNDYEVISGQGTMGLKYFRTLIVSTPSSCQLVKEDSL
ncbi:MAG: pyridoxal-phosphate dependent enzyme [Candidatus Thorarchaeota archaeon]|nr:pyridoxal-phosphate dependent enzyme [Candidatus Thorarchaeota archaeon]